MDNDLDVVGSLVSVSVVDEAGENGDVIAVLVFVYADDMAAPTEANWLFIDCVVEENAELAAGVDAADLVGFQIGFFHPVCVQPVDMEVRSKQLSSHRACRRVCEARSIVVPS
jgi:hypothetical protein